VRAGASGFAAMARGCNAGVTAGGFWRSIERRCISAVRTPLQKMASL
jgi:hypothetical protein